MKLLRDLQAHSDDQAYYCHDEELIKKHKLNNPFRCGCRRWLGAGVVSIDFYSNLPGGMGYQDSAPVLLCQFLARNGLLTIKLY